MQNPEANAKAAAIIGITAAVIIITFIAGNELLQFLGLKDDEEDKKKEAEQVKIVEGTKSEIKNYIAKGQRPSYSDAQYLKSAQIIQNATNKSWSDDQNETAVQELKRYTPKEVDFLKLQEAFGSREHFWFGVSRGKRTLVELLQSELKSSEKNDINRVWKNRGLNSRIQ